MSRPANMGICPVYNWQYVFALLLSLTQIYAQYDALLMPPKFPDLLSAFEDSLSSSESLRQAVSNAINDDMSCRCSEVTKVNWTEFNANIGSYMLPINPQCSSKGDSSSDIPNVAAVSSGQSDQKRALVIGLIIGFVILLLVLVILVTLKKFQYIHAVWAAVKRKFGMLQRQRSNCQPAFPSSSCRNAASASDSITQSNIAVLSCWSIPLTVKTVLLPLKKQQGNSNSELSDSIFGSNIEFGKRFTTTQPGHSEMSDGKCFNLTSCLQKSLKESRLEINQVLMMNKGEIFLDPAKINVLPDVTMRNKLVSSIMDTLIHAENAACSVPPNGESDDLVDQNNFHLFSPDPLSSKAASTRF